ncbi:MAG: hypothetical protein ACRDKW_10025, partial [Actinomycetota bacterium]
PGRGGVAASVTLPGMARRRRRGARHGTDPRSSDDQARDPLPPPLWIDAPEGVTVRPVQPHQAVKAYRCPGCDHEIRPGTGHVVVVPDEGPQLRRHWHSSCWQQHLRRLRPRDR